MPAVQVRHGGRFGAGEGGAWAVKGIVIDTNIVLDLFVFDDAAAKPLRAALEAGEVQWLATVAMRVELARVLGYPQIAPRLAFYGLADADVLARFDRHARLVDAAPKAPVTCSDPDDQGFIDLAVAHRAPLLSKDRAVLTMKRRLKRLGVVAASRYAPAAQPA
jgi:predicted nucleic acid-binding protein